MKKHTRESEECLDESRAKHIKIEHEETPFKVVLTEDLKELIKNNVTQLKELLKDDNDFAVELIKGIYRINYSTRTPPEAIDFLVRKHYEDEFADDAKGLRKLDTEVLQIRDIANLLSTMVVGESKIIFSATISQAKEVKKDYDEDFKGLLKSANELGVLCRKEIGTQFNPDIDYSIEIEEEFYREQEILLAGIVDNNEEL